MTQCAPPRIEWHKGPMLGFDLETTGIDTEHDRIVTAALIHIRPGRTPETVNLLANPGIDIPAAATAVHGITSQHAFEHGTAPWDVIDQITAALFQAITTGTPIVGMNLTYDLTLLDREARRHGNHPLAQTPDHIAYVTPVIDVRVLDKAMDPFRRGGRKLTDLANHYRVQLDDAHNSSADALAALRIAYAIAVRYPQLQIPLPQLHQQQIRWAATQTADFAAYRQRQGNPLDDADGSWPIKPIKTMAVSA